VNAQVEPMIDGSSDARITNSGVEMSALVAESPKVAQCFARSLFRHTVSRKEVDIADGCTLNAVEQAARTGTVKDALRSLVERPEFKLRKVSQ
jgi:hypothetical protein